LNKSTDQTKYQVHFYRAFINYIYKTVMIYVFIDILMLVRCKSRKHFQRRRKVWETLMWPIKMV